VIPYLSHGVLSLKDISVAAGCAGVHPSHPAMASCVEPVSAIRVDHKADLVQPADLPAAFAVDGSEFSWRDAGVGAGLVLALLVLAAGAAGAARFRRGTPTSSCRRARRTPRSPSRSAR
jgi:hypothetical protein